MSCATYFDALSTDDLSVVARYLSDAPRSAHWLAAVPRSVRKLLFLPSDYRSPFIRVVPLLLRSVRVNCVKDSVNSLNFFADDSLLVDVIERYGGHIRHLRIVEHERVIRKLTESMYNRLIAHCTNVTHISFWFRGYSIKKQHHKRLLRSIQRNLGELELKYEVPFSADMVARFSGCEFPALRTLKIDGPQVDGILDKLLLSNQLDRVEIQSWFSDWDVISTELRAKCPSLKTLLLKGILEGLHVPLLTSYGTRLVRGNLQWLSLECCETVIRACPNIASELSVDWTYVPRLRLLARHVAKLVLDPLEINSPSDMALLKETSAHCTQLEAVSCVSNVADTRVLDALFHRYRKPLLTYLRIGMRRAHFSTSSLVHTTGNLREADIMVGKFTDIAALTTKFIPNNPRLHTLKISQAQKISTQKIAHNIALKILGAIRTHLPHIRCIRLNLPALLVEPESIPPTRITDFCSFFRLQGVDVRITPGIIFS